MSHLAWAPGGCLPAGWPAPPGGPQSRRPRSQLADRRAPRLHPREEMQDRGIGFHPAGSRCRLVDPVLTSTAACVPGPLRVARIADFRVHSGQLDTVGLPCRHFRDARPHAGTARVAGHYPPPGNPRSRCLKNRPFRRQLPAACPRRAKPLAAPTRLASCPFRKALGRVHSSAPAHLLVWQATPRQIRALIPASSNGRILPCWVSPQP
jgi:hypothetical protein